MAEKRIFGLIGYPLTHSFSKKYFTEKFRQEQISDVEYKLFPLGKVSDIKDLIKQLPELIGLNVTIPYKEAIVPYLDQVNHIAKATGAVNTIHIENGQLKGYNTDVAGFWLSLQNIIKPYQKRSLILGTGGASKAVAYVYQQLEIPYLFVSREPSKAGEISYDDLTEDLMSTHQVIINSTPLGMMPNSDTCPPIPYQYLSAQHLLYDLIYNPEETLFLKKGKEQGTHIKNGLEMLHIQAEKSWEIWNTNLPPVGPAQAI